MCSTAAHEECYSLIFYCLGCFTIYIGCLKITNSVNSIHLNPSYMKCNNQMLVIIFPILDMVNTHSVGGLVLVVHVDITINITVWNNGIKLSHYHDRSKVKTKTMKAHFCCRDYYIKSSIMPWTWQCILKGRHPPYIIWFFFIRQIETYMIAYLSRKQHITRSS